MPGRKIPLITNQYYHAFNRGINKQQIFKGIRDYRRALELIKYYQYSNPPLRYSKFMLLATDRKQTFWKLLRDHKKNVSIIAYCLMPNHFHFLLEQIIDNGISKFMGNFQNSYTRFFNTKYSWVGPLLQGQFKAVYIEDDNQFLHIHRYIHLNPYTSFVSASLDRLLTYPWSSFTEYLNNSQIELCDKTKILSFFKNKKSYQNFILDQADYQRKLDIIKHLTLEE